MISNCLAAIYQNSVQKKLTTTASRRKRDAGVVKSEVTFTKILEPIYDVEILCDGDVMGDIMGDLQTRRAIIQGMDTEGHYQKIIVKVPLASDWLLS